MRFTRKEIAKSLLEVFAEQKDKSLFQINVIGRPFQQGNLELKLGVVFDTEERALAGNILNDLEAQRLLIRTYDDVISPNEKLKITEKGLNVLQKGNVELTHMQNVYLDGNKGEKQYKLLHKLGSGGFGDVYSALDVIEEKDVAIKIFQNNFNLTDTSALEAWSREAEQALKFHDDHVIGSYEFRKGILPDGGEKYYLVMELADGGSLSDLITIKKTKDELIAEEQLRSIFTEILLGMKIIHKVALHRDLKPENILIVNNVLKVSDFGLAKYVDQSTRTRSFKGWGTTKYMAPESWTMGKMSKATDIYSLGIMFYEISTLELPFSSADDFEMEKLHRFGAIPSVKTKNSGLSNRIEGIIKKMMQKSSSDRYQDISEILADLQQASPNSKVDVNEVVAVAKTILEKEQQSKNEYLKKMAIAQDKQDIIKYQINDFISKLNGIIDSINDHLPEKKLFLSKGTDTDFTLIWGGKDLLRVRFNSEIYISDIALNGSKILALGTIEQVQIRQDEGINFILLQNDGDDYGSWKVLEINTNALVRHIQYPRVADFAILKRIASLGNAMDIITNEIRDTVDEDIKKIILQAFDYINNPRKPEELISDPLYFPDHDEVIEDEGFGY